MTRKIPTPIECYRKLRRRKTISMGVGRNSVIIFNMWKI